MDYDIVLVNKIFVRYSNITRVHAAQEIFSILKFGRGSCDENSIHVSDISLINWVGLLKIWAWKILSYCANNPWEIEILEMSLLGELVGFNIQLDFMEDFTLCSIGFHSVYILIFCSQQPYIAHLLTQEDGIWNPIRKNLSNFYESN